MWPSTQINEPRKQNQFGKISWYLVELSSKGASFLPMSKLMGIETMSELGTATPGLRTERIAD